ncbi:signal recognition particle-docking protein FtsY [Bdellovibrio sp. qaytius]|nr:signal recognition particle-docking protein FtsY [Bdellovibrio sp. qaytius]
MSESSSYQMNLLLIVIAVLALAIFIPVILSFLKKKKQYTPPPLDNAQADLAPLHKSEPPPQIELPELLAETAPKVEEDLSSSATIDKAMEKTKDSFFGRIKNAFTNTDKKKVLEEIEEVLYTSDLGPKTVQKLLDKVSSSDMSDISKVKESLASQMQEILLEVHASQKDSKLVSDLIHKRTDGPMVLMVVGVNGAGKTTSIGKITAQLAHQGFKVLVAAGDTFRAAAGGQLKVWTERAQNANGHVEIFWPDNVTDPAAVAFDAVNKGKAGGYDFVILDTAGRLHTQGHLMDELKKVKRVMAKVIPEAPHETWIVLDANSGQNALNQAVEFNKALEVTGVVLTKMDGTAKGGVALGVVDQLAKPIRLVGLGEKIGDLKVFEPKEYIDSILG